jgi:hypothetical protein
MSKSTKTAELSNKIEALEQMVAELMINNKNATKVAKEKKPRNMTEKGHVHKAKLIFYQDNKGSDKVKQLVKERHSDDVTVSFKNWRKIKVITDEMFENLSDKQKDQYIEKAKSSIEEAEPLTIVDEV